MFLSLAQISPMNPRLWQLTTFRPSLPGCLTGISVFCTAELSTVSLQTCFPPWPSASQQTATKSFQLLESPLMPFPHSSHLICQKIWCLCPLNKSEYYRIWPFYCQHPGPRHCHLSSGLLQWPPHSGPCSCLGTPAICSCPPCHLFLPQQQSQPSTI